MDSTTNTEYFSTEVEINQENILFDIVKELCSKTDCKVSQKVADKVNRIIDNCHHRRYHSLHVANPVDGTTFLFGFNNQISTELTFDEQSELNQAVIESIQSKIPKFTSELETLKTTFDSKKSHRGQIKKLEESLDDKLNTLEKQENEKVELMMEWLNHRLQDVVRFNDNSSELLSLKTQILELKSKILHLQILQNIFTETNQSIKAYNEIHNDLQCSIIETERNIEHLQRIIANDYA